MSVFFRHADPSGFWKLERKRFRRGVLARRGALSLPRVSFSTTAPFSQRRISSERARIGLHSALWVRRSPRIKFHHYVNTAAVDRDEKHTESERNTSVLELIGSRAMRFFRRSRASKNKSVRKKRKDDISYRGKIKFCFKIELRL